MESWWLRRCLRGAQPHGTYKLLRNKILRFAWATQRGGAPRPKRSLSTFPYNLSVISGALRRLSSMRSERPTGFSQHADFREVARMYRDDPTEEAGLRLRTETGRRLSWLLEFVRRPRVEYENVVRSLRARVPPIPATTREISSRSRIQAREGAGPGLS